MGLINKIMIGLNESKQKLKIRFTCTKEQRDLVGEVDGTLICAERAAISGRPGLAGEYIVLTQKLIKNGNLPYDVSKRVNYIRDNYTVVLPGNSNPAS